MKHARFLGAARLEYFAEIAYYSEIEAGLGVRFTDAVHWFSRLRVPRWNTVLAVSFSRTFHFLSSIVSRTTASLSLRLLPTRRNLVTGAPGYVPANHALQATHNSGAALAVVGA